MDHIDPLRFCMVTSFYPPYHFGGDGMFVYRLSEALAEAGHKVDVVHSVDAFKIQKDAVPAEGFTHHPNVTLHPLESAYPSLSLLSAHQMGAPGLYGPQLKEIFSSRRYDVIHYHNVSLMGGPGVMRLGEALKLYTAHEYWLVCPTHVLFRYDGVACTEKRCLRCTLHYHRPPQLWRNTGLLKRSLEAIDCLLMPSRFALQRHQAEGIDRPMIHLPHFVPVSAPPAADLRRDRPFFLYVGRLEELKGAQELIRIFDKYPHADLVIVGEGTYGVELRFRAAGMQHIKFMGRMHPSRLSALYEQAIALMVPSLCYETFGLTAAEALMHGTPVIVRKIGALSEIVANGGGYAFQTDAECLAAMEKLRTDPAHRAELGARGKEIAENRWSVQAHLGRYLRLIRAMVKSDKQDIQPAVPV
jgi:glycosyltransferase involved in cell wall biosynthesis